MRREDSFRPSISNQGVPAEGSAFCGAGQNARLAARLTGWKIDIKPASAPDEEPELVPEEAAEPEEKAEDTEGAEE